MSQQKSAAPAAPENLIEPLVHKDNNFQSVLKADTDSALAGMNNDSSTNNTLVSSAELLSLDKFRRSILDQKKNYPLPRPVINLVQNGNTIPFLTKKAYSLFQGKQKSKKTTVLALAVAAFIFNYSFNNQIRFAGASEGVAIFFDTEQGESYAARTMKLILKIAGLESSPNLIYCDLRCFSPKERREIIKAGIKNTHNVQLVVIDGIVDLMTDFMDAAEGQMTITDLVNLTSDFDIHIAGVLHQNKADKNARAHVGSISSQKCEVEITTEVDPDDRNQSFVSCVNSRGLPFETFAIRWDKGALPCINQEWSSNTAAGEKANKNFEKSKAIAETIFKPFAAVSYTDAVTAVMNTMLKSESTAKRVLKDFIGWGFITKGPDGNYRIKTDEGARVHEGSNGVHEPGS